MAPQPARPVFVLLYCVFSYSLKYYFCTKWLFILYIEYIGRFPLSWDHCALILYRRPSRGACTILYSISVCHPAPSLSTIHACEWDRYTICTIKVFSSFIFSSAFLSPPICSSLCLVGKSTNCHCIGSLRLPSNTSMLLLLKYCLTARIYHLRISFPFSSMFTVFSAVHFSYALNVHLFITLQVLLKSVLSLLLSCLLLIYNKIICKRFQLE